VMSIIVEHEKRRREILGKALNVFMEEGFEDATFQKIADQCGITRTTLYMYFKNKKEIFNYSIKQLLEGIEYNINQVQHNPDMNSTTKLITVLSVVLDRLEENCRLLRVILDYLRHLSKNGFSLQKRVHRRTIRLRHIFSTMIIKGIEAGDLVPVNIKNADTMLYSLVEAAIFHITVLGKDSVQELKPAITFVVEQMSLKPSG
jgi:AcrR family transcriptional regulator